MRIYSPKISPVIDMSVAEGAVHSELPQVRGTSDFLLQDIMVDMLEIVTFTAIRHFFGKQRHC
jgi:hypothetical protein